MKQPHKTLGDQKYRQGYLTDPKRKNAPPGSGSSEGKRIKNPYKGGPKYLYVGEEDERSWHLIAHDPDQPYNDPLNRWDRIEDSSYEVERRMYDKHRPKFKKGHKNNWGQS